MMIDYMSFLEHNLNNENPAFAISWFERPQHHYDYVNQVILDAVTHIDQPKSEAEHLEKKERVLKFIELRYDNYIWRLHDTHFHPNLKSFINCPFTCNAELAEIIEKIKYEQNRA